MSFWGAPDVLSGWGRLTATCRYGVACVGGSAGRAGVESPGFRWDCKIGRVRKGEDLRGYGGYCDWGRKALRDVEIAYDAGV